MSATTEKTKIAILGGGLSSITAAYELTQRPEDREKYDITIYQMGWRIGGKGASGRNREYGDRIEEHGLHIGLPNAFEPDGSVAGGPAFPRPSSRSDCHLPPHDRSLPTRTLGR